MVLDFIQVPALRKNVFPSVDHHATLPLIIHVQFHANLPQITCLMKNVPWHTLITVIAFKRHALTQVATLRSRSLCFCCEPPDRSRTDACSHQVPADSCPAFLAMRKQKYPGQRISTLSLVAYESTHERACHLYLIDAFGGSEERSSIKQVLTQLCLLWLRLEPLHRFLPMPGHYLSSWRSPEPLSRLPCDYGPAGTS